MYRENLYFLASDWRRLLGNELLFGVTLKVNTLDVTGVTAASSGTSDSRVSRVTHTHTLVQKTGVSPVRRHWRAQQRDVSIPEGGRGDTGRGLRDGA